MSGTWPALGRSATSGGGGVECRVLCLKEEGKLGM